MSVLPLPVLTDASTPPTLRVIHGHLGEVSRIWDLVFAHVHEAHPGFEEQWRYYSDGHSWLMKVVHGSRTVCWVSVAEGSFRVTVYLPERATDVVADSGLPAEVKAQFTQGRTGARTRAITLTPTDEADVEVVEQLLALRDGFR